MRKMMSMGVGSLGGVAAGQHGIVAHHAVWAMPRVVAARAAGRDERAQPVRSLRSTAAGTMELTSPPSEAISRTMVELT
jgi:hypothetical protein